MRIRIFILSYRAGKNSILSRSVLQNYVKLTEIFYRAGKNGFSVPLGERERIVFPSRSLKKFVKLTFFTEKRLDFKHFHVKLTIFHVFTKVFWPIAQIYKNTVLAQGGGKE